MGTRQDPGKSLVTFHRSHFAMQSGQSGGGQPPSRWRGARDGEMHAEKISTAGKFAGGLAVGLFTGPIGTGIGYFLLGPAQLDGDALAAMAGKGADYEFGFRIGWERKTQSRKRGKYLAGGILGTVVGVAIVWTTVFALSYD